MIIRSAQLRPLQSFTIPLAHSTSAGQTQFRCLHYRVKAAAVPRPTPFVPDVNTFLTLIGRQLAKKAAKIPSWNALFSMTSRELQELDVGSPRDRRYILRWRDKFRNGKFGIGGDVRYVENGVAELRISEISAPEPTVLVDEAAAATSPRPRQKIVVNVPAGIDSAAESGSTAQQYAPVKGLHIRAGHTIVGHGVLQSKGHERARIEVKEGLWEDVRGRKLFGGERRQAEVLAQMRRDEKRAAK